MDVDWLERAHPRAGGENRFALHVYPAGTGSSPRGRGKLDRVREPLAPPGLIPARAGKTTRQTRRIRSLAAHPRAGGENDPTDPTHPLACGSSPRGRGKLAAALNVQPSERLIPARAGKTMQSTYPDAHYRAHPRAGGENGARFTQSWPRSGSSPRGRGKRADEEAPAGRVGLIPARAGKTPLARWPRGPRQAHPRAGGENVTNRHVIAGGAGSSPRGRGKRLKRCTNR